MLPFTIFRRQLKRISNALKTGPKWLREPVVINYRRRPATRPAHRPFPSLLYALTLVLFGAPLLWSLHQQLTCGGDHLPGLDHPLLLAGLPPVLDPLGEAARRLDASLQRLLRELREDFSLKLNARSWVGALEQLSGFLPQLQQDRATAIRELLHPRSRGL